MLHLRPTSISQLTALGFLAVVAPLVIGLVIVARQLDSLGRYSQTTISEAAEVMRITRATIEQANGLERNARQYAILADEDLLALYANRRDTFRETLHQLADLGVGSSILGTIGPLAVLEESTFAAMQQSGTALQLDDVPLLASLAQSLARDAAAWVDLQVSALESQVNNTQDSLRVIAAVLIVVTILIALTFILLITRPLSQIDRAIHQLGSGALSKNIRVSGPQDIKELGERLDWLRQRLGDLEQQRTLFMQRVSHELKTPLAAIQEGTALLSEGVVGPLSERQRELTVILKQNSQRLLELIENLLRSRVDEVGTIQRHSSRVRLVRVIEDVIRDQKLVLEARQIRLVRKYDKVTVQANQEHLRVVIDNLLSNAVKYSPVGGSITISCLKNGEQVIFSVADEGPGISVDERPHVFEAFYQGTPAAEGSSGTGLGLAIVQEYMRMNGGEIRLCDSEVGACFEASLPLKQNENEP